MSNLTPRINDIEAKAVKNYLVNGGFDFWQRGTSGSFSTSSTISSYLLADRFSEFGSNNSTKTFNLSREEDLPNDLKTGYSYKLELTNSATPTGNDALFYGIHRLEYKVIEEIYNKNFIYSFYFKSNVVGTHYIYFFNPLQSRLKVVPFEVTQADVWERHSITSEWDSLITETGNGRAMDIGFVAMTNGDFAGHPPSNNWENRVNGLSVTESAVNYAVSGNYFQVAGVMMYDADFGEDIPFQRAGRNYAEELQLCQRYFEKSWNIDDAIGTSGSESGLAFTEGSNVSDSYVTGYVSFKATKRVSPAMFRYDKAGTINRISQRTVSNWTLTDGISTRFAGFTTNLNGFTFRTSAPNNIKHAIHWTADAEL